MNHHNLSDRDCKRILTALAPRLSINILSGHGDLRPDYLEVYLTKALQTQIRRMSQQAQMMKLSHLTAKLDLAGFGFEPVSAVFEGAKIGALRLTVTDKTFQFEGNLANEQGEGGPFYTPRVGVEAMDLPFDLDLRILREDAA